MDLIEEQFAQLQSRYPEATRTTNPDGSTTITIPRLPLPDGWNKHETTVVFALPIGYPYAKPDCFWTDPDLRLSTGARPANSDVKSPPGVSSSMLWFSYHASTWNANTDSIITYTNVIRARLADRK
jgi:Prokaryotic E2 family E